MSDRTVWRLEAENERLRDEVSRLRLTDAEREALEVALHWCSPYPYRKEAKAIRRFLDRTADCATSTTSGNFAFRESRKCAIDSE